MATKAKTTKKYVPATKAELTKRGKVMRRLIAGEIAKKGELTNWCKENTATAGLRRELMELVLPLCRTKEQRDSEKDASNEFYTIRSTLLQESRMGKGKTWSIGTKVDKDSEGNMLQAPTCNKHFPGAKKADSKVYDKDSALSAFATWCEGQSIQMLGSLLENGGPLLKSTANRIYETQANAARGKKGNTQAAKARAGSTKPVSKKKKKVAAK